ncbi:hypothetical protein DFH06DRAFT_1130487 [Mycena polygramma]|nr:hypothetical protein DFH06DRAFT_1130487 [Mycena polygramma]
MSATDRETISSNAIENIALEEIPDLRKYEAAWPLHFYLDKYRYHRSFRRKLEPQIPIHRHTRSTPRSRRQSKTIAQGIDEEESPDSSNVMVSHERLPGLTILRCAGLIAGEEQSPDSSNVRLSREGSLGHFRLTILRRAGLTADALQVGDTGPSDSRFGSASPTLTRLQNGSFPQACIFCGFQPQIPDYAATELSALFQEHGDLRPIVFAGGIRHDHDLYLFRQLDTTEQANFLQTDWMASLPELQKIQLETLLLKVTESARSSELEVQNVAMSDLNLTLKEYHDLRASVKPHLQYSLDHSKRLQEQDSDRLELMFREIRAQLPILGSLADNSLLRMITKEFLGKSNEGGPRNHLAFADTHKCSLRSIHTDPKTQFGDQLRCRGLGELIPAFSILGITSDEQFRAATIPSTAERLKATMYGKRFRAHLSALQSFNS